MSNSRKELRWSIGWCELMEAHVHNDFHHGIALLTRGVLQQTSQMLNVQTPKGTKA